MCTRIQAWQVCILALFSPLTKDLAVHGHHDLALLLVGLHVSVCVDNSLQREGGIDDGLQRARFEAVVDILLAAGKPLGILYDLKQQIAAYC